MAAVACPECGATLAQAAQLHEGEQVTCKQCDAHLEVISLLPLELDWVYAEAYQAPEEPGDSGARGPYQIL